MHGKELPRATQPFYFAVNKPKGYLCANAPNKEGTTKLVVDLFEVRASFASHPSQLHPTGPCSRLSITMLFCGSVNMQHWLAPPVLSPAEKGTGFLSVDRWTVCCRCSEVGVCAFQEWQASWKERHQHPSAVAPRLFTVGRLDVASTGLIFVTNDGKKSFPPSARTYVSQWATATWIGDCEHMIYALLSLRTLMQCSLGIMR